MSGVHRGASSGIKEGPEEIVAAIGCEAFCLIFDLVQTPIFIVQAGRIAYANGEGLKKLECTLEEATKRKVHFLAKKYSKNSPQDTAKAFLQVLKSQNRTIQTIKIIGEEGEPVFVQMQTERIEYNLLPALLLVIRYLKGSIDTQEMPRADLEINSKLADFILTIRDPLQSILNASYYIYEELSNQPSSHFNRDEAKKMLSVVDDAIVRANQIIVDLTEYREDRPLLLELVRVESLIEEARRCITVNSNIVFRGTGNLLQLPLLKLDRQDIVRAFGRILRSIAAFMPRGGILTISAVAVDGSLEFSFSGSEFHIAEEKFALLFEPFSFLNQKGMGLNLPIAKRFVERNGGFVLLRNAAGKGTEFVVKLPGMSFNKNELKKEK